MSSTTNHSDGSSDTTHVDLDLTGGGFNASADHVDPVGNSQYYSESSHYGETDISSLNADVNGHTDFQEMDNHVDGSIDTYESHHIVPGEIHS